VERRFGNYAVGLALAAALAALCLHLRLPWATAVGERGDMRLFTEWARAGGELRASGEGFGYLYTRKRNCNYPPFYPTVLSFLPSIFEWWHGHPGLNAHLIARVPLSTRSPHARAWARVSASAQFIKLPAMIADVAIVFLLLGWVWARSDLLRGMVAAGIWALNPVSIYNSAYFGQVDAIHSLWMLAALMAAVDGRVAIAWAFTALALLTKLQAIAIVPVVAIVTLRPLISAMRGADAAGMRRQVRRLLAATLAAAAVAGVILAPFARAGTLDRVREVYAHSVSDTNNARITVTAHNLWWLLLDQSHKRIVHAPRDDVPFAGPVTARHVGYALFVWLTAAVCLAVFTGGGRCSALLGAAAIALGFFLVCTQMKARYGFAAMALTVPLITCGYRYVLATVILSATLLINGAHVLEMPEGFLNIAVPVNYLARQPGAGHAVAVGNLMVLGYLLVELARTARRERAPHAGAQAGA
jgi:hypothetical protein